MMFDWPSGCLVKVQALIFMNSSKTDFQDRLFVLGIDELARQQIKRFSHWISVINPGGSSPRPPVFDGAHLQLCFGDVVSEAGCTAMPHKSGNDSRHPKGGTVLSGGLPAFQLKGPGILRLWCVSVTGFGLCVHSGPVWRRPGIGRVELGPGDPAERSSQQACCSAR